MNNSLIRTAKIRERIREIRESNPYLTVNSRLLDLRANLPFGKLHGTTAFRDLCDLFKYILRSAVAINKGVSNVDYRLHR